MTEQPRNQLNVVQDAEKKRDQYRKDATVHQTAYYISEAAALTLLFLTPILALTQKPIWAAVSSSSGLLAGLSTKYRWRKNWIQCLETSKAIDKEIVLFKLRQDSQKSEKALVYFVKAIYNIESNHMKDWARDMSVEKPNDGEENDNKNNNE